nr:MAG TPA: hypothetical protein [Caudoviricetes sp.]
MQKKNTPKFKKKPQNACFIQKNNIYICIVEQ